MTAPQPTWNKRSSGTEVKPRGPAIPSRPSVVLTSSAYCGLYAVAKRLSRDECILVTKCPLYERANRRTRSLALETWPDGARSASLPPHLLLSRRSVAASATYNGKTSACHAEAAGSSRSKSVRHRGAWSSDRRARLGGRAAETRRGRSRRTGPRRRQTSARRTAVRQTTGFEASG
jgi:hypothetical protein